MINFRPLDAAITTRGALENVLQSQRVYQFRRRHFFYSPLCGPGASCADRCAGRLRPGQHPWPVGRPAAAPLGRPYSSGCGSMSRDRHADVELCFAAKAQLNSGRGKQDGLGSQSNQAPLASIHRSIRSACFRPDCCTRSFPWCVRAWASCCSPVLRLVRGSWARGRGSGWPRGPSGCGPGLGWSGRCGGRAAGRSEEVQPFLLPVPAFGQVQGDVPAAVPGGAGGHGDQVAADGRGPGFGEGAAG